MLVTLRSLNLCNKIGLINQSASKPYTLNLLTLGAVLNELQMGSFSTTFHWQPGTTYIWWGGSELLLSSIGFVHADRQYKEGDLKILCLSFFLSPCWLLSSTMFILTNGSCGYQAEEHEATTLEEIAAKEPEFFALVTTVLHRAATEFKFWPYLLDLLVNTFEFNQPSRDTVLLSYPFLTKHGMPKLSSTWIGMSK